MKKKFQVVIYALVLAIVFIIAATVLLFLQNKKLKDITDQANTVQADLNSNLRSVYIATTDIVAGAQVIEGVNVDVQQIYSSIEDYDDDGDGYNDIYMNAEQLGQRARINIKAGAPIQAQMLTHKEITKDTRTYEISVVNISTDLVEHDVVDVRIVFPDGRDYIVLPKKEVESLNGSVMNMNLNEDEIVRMKSATADAADLGAKMYTTKYVERTLQDASIPFYPVRQTTIALIASDPNVLELAEKTLSSQAREALEERMIQIKQQYGEGESLSADFESKIKLTTPDPAEGTLTNDYTLDGVIDEDTAETIN